MRWKPQLGVLAIVRRAETFFSIDKRTRERYCEF